uniref:Gamma-tubulin complex component n=1 Tax=Parascaris univalens TaxID=6257 RepID=A0A915AWY8_PARUN
MRPIGELRQFGRCDHAICSLCIMNAPMVEGPDGSMGCCNAQCFAADLAAICPDPKLRRKFFKMIINNTDVDKLWATYRGSGRRNLKSVERALKQLSSLTSLSSAPISGDIIKEMMIVNVMILENGPYQTIRRHRISEELGSTCTIRKVMECISSATSMWEDEVLQAIGDSIWGRLTLLISSLVGHKCTARERADAYEALLLSSISDNDKEMAQIPVESLIDEATENFMKTGDNSAVKKFRRTVERLRANDDENDGIIRFLLLMANWDAVSATLLESGGGRPLRDTLNIPGYRRRCPSLEFSMDGSRKRETKVSFTMSPVVHTLSFQGSTSSVCTSSVSDGEKMALEELIFDERGNVHPLASGQAIRSLWLPPGSTFEMVSWYDFIICLQSLVRGEECSIFEGGTRGSPHILRHSRSILSLEFEGPLALMRFASPFLAFANKLQEVNNFLCCEDRPPEEWCSSDCALHLRPFHILSFHLQDCLRKIRDELSREIAADIDMYCDRVEAMGRMRKVLLKSRAFSYFCDIILTIRQRADYGCSALIDVFFSARTLLGNVEEDMGKLCDEVLLVLVRHFHQSILKWLCKGDDSLSEGVFRSRFSDMMMMAKETPLLTRSNIGDVVKLWRNDFGLSLPSNGLLSEEFCAKWMLEGKMRKMMKLWRTVDSNIAETMPVYELKIDAENEVESDRLLEAINSKQPDRAVQTLLSEKYAAIVNMPPARRLRRDIMDSFRATLMFIEKTFLCKDGFFIDGIVRKTTVLLNR